MWAEDELWIEWEYVASTEPINTSLGDDLPTCDHAVYADPQPKWMWSRRHSKVCSSSLGTSTLDCDLALIFGNGLDDYQPNYFHLPKMARPLFLIVAKSITGWGWMTEWNTLTTTYRKHIGPSVRFGVRNAGCSI